MNKDTLIGIVGSVLLVAAMIGVFTYERSQGAALAGNYAVEWTIAESTGPSAQAATPLGETRETTLDVTQTNLTEVALVVTWTAGQGRDTLRVTVTPPEGSGLNATENPVEGDSGEVRVVFPVPNPAPAASSAFGADEQEANARLAQSYAPALGTGTWTIAVEFVSAEGVLPVPGAPVGSDTEVQWTATAAQKHHAPTFTKR